MNTARVFTNILGIFSNLKIAVQIKCATNQGISDEKLNKIKQELTEIFGEPERCHAGELKWLSWGKWDEFEVNIFTGEKE